MLRVYGVPITPEDGRRLIATLIADGGPDQMTAAEMIGKGIGRVFYAVALSPAERDAVLSTLEDVDEGPLAELRR
ncbi:MAG: hypothetical protein LH654_15200 [Thermoleophilia bacterium]|nr:hypothetical protein [Thermoleophilia bacterium]